MLFEMLGDRWSLLIIRDMSAGIPHHKAWIVEDRDEYIEATGCGN
jgi:DNA-binding HxlR family transcriptional regulator